MQKLSGSSKNFFGANRCAAAQPVDGLVPPEPGQLPLGVMPGGLLHLSGGLGQGALAVQRGQEFLVADGLQGGGLFGNPSDQQAADLFYLIFTTTL